MINLVFRFFLAFNSTSLILVVYWIKSGVTMNFVPPYMMHVPNYMSYLLYVGGMILLTYLSLVIANYLDRDSIAADVITSIESANNSFLPSYLGYFFVALDVPNNETLCFVYAIIFTFTFFSQALYFNPLFLLFGYQFYNLTNVNQVTIFMITKLHLKDPSVAVFPKLLRINDYTFLNKET